jgi:hypothetical protein
MDTVGIVSLLYLQQAKGPHFQGWPKTAERREVVSERFWKIEPV